MQAETKNVFKIRLFRFGLEIVLVLLVYFTLKAYMQRDLIAGVAPPLAATLLDGQAFNLQSTREQPVLLHFWASWCSICRLEEDGIAEISKDHRVITIAMQSGNEQEVEAYLQRQGLDFPVIVDQYGEIAKRFGVRGVPTSFVIDARGNIDFTEVGFTSEWGLRLRLWLAAQ